MHNGNLAVWRLQSTHGHQRVRAVVEMDAQNTTALSQAQQQSVAAETVGECAAVAKRVRQRRDNIAFDVANENAAPVRQSASGEGTQQRSIGIAIRRFHETGGKVAGCCRGDNFQIVNRRGDRAVMRVEQDDDDSGAQSGDEETDECRDGQSEPGFESEYKFDRKPSGEKPSAAWRMTDQRVPIGPLHPHGSSWSPLDMIRSRCAASLRILHI